MKYGLVGSLLAVAAAALVVAVACGGDDAMPSPTPSSPGVSIEPPAYSEPSPVSTGEYKPVRSGESAREILEPLGFERASGDEINGIRLFDDYTEYFQYKDLCGSGDFKEFRDFQGMGFEYLPRHQRGRAAGRGSLPGRVNRKLRAGVHNLLLGVPGLVLGRESRLAAPRCRRR